MKWVSVLLLLFCFSLPIFAQIGPNPDNNVNTWRVEQVYTTGNAVVRNGVLYVSLVTNNVAFDPSGSPSQWGKVFSNGSSALANTTVAVTGAVQGANSCSSATTATVTGLTTSNVILPGYSASPAALTGWGSTAGMVFQAWPSAANTMSWIVCNQTTGSITYSAITFNVAFK